jgi:hypothetical protein
MSVRLLGLAAAAGLLASIGAANAKAPVRLTDGRLDQVTTGATNTQILTNSAIFSNGSNGFGGVNQFSPSTATISPSR